MLFLTYHRHLAEPISTKVPGPNGRGNLIRLLFGFRTLAAVFSGLTARGTGLYLAMTVPGVKSNGTKREYGADDPKGIQDRGCPRNCERIAVHPRGAERRHATALVFGAGRQMGDRYSQARRPAVEHRSIITGGDARRGERHGRHPRFIALLRIVFPRSPSSTGRPGALKAS